MEFFRNISARRRDVRRNLPKPAPRWLRMLREREYAWALLFTLALAVVASLISLTAERRTRHVVDQTLAEPLVARVDFRAVDAAASAERRKDARDREPAVYTLNQAYVQYVRDQFAFLARLTTDEIVDEKIRQSLDLPQEGLAELRRWIVGGQPTPGWQAITEQFKHDLWGLPSLTPEQAQIELDEARRAPKIVIQHPDLGEIEKYRNEIFSVKDEIFRTRLTELTRDRFPKPLPRTIVALILQNPPPAYVYNDELTRERRRIRALAEPQVEKNFQANDVIIAAGKRLDPVDLELIKRERQAYAAYLVDEIHPLLPMASHLGRFGVIALLSFGIWGYILAYNTRLARNAMRGLAFTGLLLLSLALAVWATRSYPALVYMTATLPTLLAGFVLAIAYDRRFALAVGAMHTLLIIFTLDLPLEAGFVLLVGMGIGIGQLNEIRNILKLLMTGLWAGGAMAAAMIIVGFATQPLHVPHQVSQIFLNAWIVFGTGIATGLLAQAVYPAVEKFFRVTTAMTLKELSDASLPLLRRLAQEAPGTYQHSLRIADMAEEAAQAIGANALLCKVGAMYHDIGKINKPLYFVENQGGGPNRHSKLSPAMSLLIIVGHVKDGIEMAREYRLPPTIRQFIETHHGTTLIEYFYHAAKQQREGLDEPAPSEFEFRYPGPKPQTKEAAILMICDGIEGAARTLQDPNPLRLEQLVQRMSHKRLTDGQFDECGITLQELHKIEQSIAKTLAAMYHGRIAYPSDKTEADTPQTQAAS